MGMDVYGNNPTSPKGEYFRRNVWGWHPLAELVCELAPEESEACTMWHTNDGDGLGGADALALAERLQQLLDDGTIENYVKARDAQLNALPDVTCSICAGTGVRTDALAIERGIDKRVIGPDMNANESHPRFGQTGWCNSCDGIGHTRPGSTNYYLEVVDVAEFTGFLRDCGGFEIC